MEFRVNKDYAPHNYKKGDVVLINEKWSDFIKELTTKGIIEPLKANGGKH